MTITPSDLRALADTMPAAIDDPETRTGWIASAFAALHRVVQQRDDQAARIAVLRSALETELTELGRRGSGSTHWAGCGAVHPMCAAIQRMQFALAAANDGKAP